jgi:hypothetical protein
MKKKQKQLKNAPALVHRLGDGEALKHERDEETDATAPTTTQ